MFVFSSVPHQVQRVFDDTGLEGLMNMFDETKKVVEGQKEVKQVKAVQQVKAQKPTKKQEPAVVQAALPAPDADIQQETLPLLLCSHLALDITKTVRFVGDVFRMNPYIPCPARVRYCSGA